MFVIRHRISLGDQTGRTGWAECVAACRDDKLIIPIGEVKVKLKFNLEESTKAQRGSRGIALLFFNLGAR
jgi:hypothetical protein